jgi:hypothetical protein
MGLTPMAMPGCILRQGCLWVSRHEKGLWVRTGTPRLSAVPTVSGGQMPTLFALLAGKEGAEVHSHRGHEYGRVLLL